MDFNQTLQKIKEAVALSNAEELLRSNGIKINKVLESKTSKKNDPFDLIIQQLQNEDKWKKFSTKFQFQFVYKNAEDKSEVFVNLRGKDGLGFITV